MNNSLDDKKISIDRMRYKKDTLSYLFVLLGLLFNVFYFFNIFNIDDDNFYKPLMGVSVIYNLLFMLTVFLSAEEVKAYKIAFDYVLIGVAVLQLARIFVYPILTVIQKIETPQIIDGVEKMVEGTIKVRVMSPDQIVWPIIFLVTSAVFLAAGALNSINNVNKLNAYKRELALERGV